MKIHRFYMPEFSPQDGEFVTQNSELIHQLTKVLRMKVGNTVQVFDGKGGEWTVGIGSVDRKELRLKILSISSVKPKPKVSLRVYLPIIKKDRLEWAVEKLTEIGVESIAFVTTARTLEKNVNWQRINKIAIEASEQSGRTVLPEIKKEVLSVDKIANSAKSWGAETLVFGDASAARLGEAAHWDKLALLIGPEGGFTDQDLTEIKKDGIIELTPASFGENILRAETAAVVGAGIISSI